MSPSIAEKWEQNSEQLLRLAMWFRPGDGASHLQRNILGLDSNALIRDKAPYLAFFEATPQQLVDTGLAHHVSGGGLYELGMMQDYSDPEEKKCDATMHSNPDQHGVAQWSRTENTFNSNGYYGEGVNVGIVELISQNEGVWDGHVSLSQINGGSGVIYQSTPPVCMIGVTTCPQDSSCLEDISGVSRCMREHTSLVSSRMSATSVNNPHHAARANLFIANGGFYRNHTNNKDWIQAYNTLIDRYNWLHTNGVKIVNKSYGVSSIDTDGRVVTYQDSLNAWYTYHRGMVFVRAASNDGPFEADCHALNSICVGSIDSKCTYDNYSDDIHDVQSSWRNPHNRYNINQLACGVSGDSTYNAPPCLEGRRLHGNTIDNQIERPDVVAEGASALSMFINSQHGQHDEVGYKRVSGTSFAAPVITGMLALCTEAHRRAGLGELSPLRHKVLTRASAVEYQRADEKAAHVTNKMFYPTFTNYGTSDPVEYRQDSKVGAGIISGEIYYRYCTGQSGEGDGPRQGSGELQLNLNGGSSVPSTWITDPPESTHIEYGDLPDLIAMGMGLRDSIYANDYQKGEIVNFGAVGAGTRIRVVAAYDACPASFDSGDPSTAHGSSGLAPVTSNQPDIFPSFDLDLAMCDETTNVCEIFSESLRDSVEGFDIVTSNNHKALKVYALWRNGSQGCNRSEDVNFAFTWLIWNG